MFQKFIDDFRESVGRALQLVSFAAAVAFCLFITASFLCAAAFVFVLQKYGVLEACLAGAGVFFIAALLAGICYAIRKREARKKPVRAAKSPVQSALSDPIVLATGLQIVRAVGLKRIIPIIAIGGIALGLLASRQHNDKPDPEPEL